MEININKGRLTDALGKVSRAISARTVIPVLSGIQIVADDDGLVLTGSNSDLTIRSFIPNDNVDEAEVKAEGSIVLPAKEFTSIARSMPENNIDIKVGDNLVTEISSGKSKFTLNGVNGNEYPKLDEVNSDGLSIDGEVLSDLIEKTSYATSKTDTRPVLTGVNLSFDEDVFSVVATDSHRLSRLKGIQFKGNPLDKDVVIPESTLKELPKLIKGEKEVSVVKNNNQLIFQTEESTIYSRLLQGNYPETDRLIPNNSTTSLSVNRLNFLESMERAAILAELETNIVTFNISGESKGIFETIELTHENQELGQSKEEIIVDKIEGEEIKLSFNPQYMIDALKRIDDNDILIEFNGAMRPFTIKPMDRSIDYVQLILPVRTY